MPRPPKPKPAYYTTWIMGDGTVVMAIPSGKPNKSPRQRVPVADEEGCHGWMRWDDDAHAWADWAKGVVRGAVVNQINLSKTLRSRVENRLERIEKQLGEITATLRRLEERPRRPPGGTGAGADT